MKKKTKHTKIIETESSSDLVKEPNVEYLHTKSIQVFSSFETEGEYTARHRAALSYDERLSELEALRALVYSHLMLPDGSWKPLEKRITITKR